MFDVYFNGFAHGLCLQSDPETAKMLMHMLRECICLRYKCVQLNTLMSHAQNSADVADE